MKLEPREIVPGVVVYFDSEVLEAQGVYCPRWHFDRIRKVRPYVCVWTDGESAIFVPLSSSAGCIRFPRLLIPAEYRFGTRDFIRKPSYACGQLQYYEGTLAAFCEASKKDRVQPGNRNRVHESFLPRILQFVGLGGLA